MTRAFLPRTLVAAGALAVLACGGEPAPEPGHLVEGELSFAPHVEAIGDFDLRFEGTSWSDARLVIARRDRPGEPALETLPGRAFLEIARGRAELAGDRVEDRVQERCADLSIDGLEAELYVLRLSGRFRCRVLDRSFELFFVPEGPAELRVHARLTDASFNRITLVAARVGADADRRLEAEHFHGLGARDTLAIDGRRVPVWVGRAAPEETGLQARLARWLERTPALAPPSLAPVPHLLSSRGRSLLLENPEYSVFDLRAPDRIRVEVFASELTFRIEVGARPLAGIAAATAAAGRIGPLPTWAQGGPLVSLEGGSAEVRRRLGALVSADVAPAALELRDWFAPGSLDPDPTRYPDARALVTELARAGVHVVVTLDPRIPESGGDAAMAALRGEADAAGYWVRDAAGEPWVGDGLRLIDLSNPDARAWWAAALRRHVVDLGVAGFVVVGGDALPGDAQLAADASAFDEHNRWASEGARVARQALGEGHGLVLSATGFTDAPAQGVVLLAGDAGDPKAWARLLSAGLSGFAFGVVDVDGAAAPEARARALGAAAFAPLFRVRAEDFSDEQALAALARATRLHAAWRDYRAELVRQAAASGAPLLRAPFLFGPDVPDTGSAFFVGDALLVAPVFEAGAERVEVDLPPGRWVDAWTGALHGLPDRGVRVAIDAPGGRAALLHPEGSLVGRRLARALAGPS